MDVKNMLRLPHNHMEELKNQQNHLLSIITMAKTAKEEDLAGLPPLHSLMSRLDAIQGSKELEFFDQESQPAFVVDINSRQEDLIRYGQDAFKVELSSL